MARRMRTQAEISAHVSPFLSARWMERKKNKETKVKNIQVRTSWKNEAQKYEGTNI